MKKTGREPQVPGRAGGGGQSRGTAALGSRRIGRRLYQRTAGRGRRHPAGDGIAVPSHPLAAVGRREPLRAGRCGQARPVRVGTGGHAACFGGVRPALSAGGRRSVATIPAPAVAARCRRRTAGRFPAGADIAAPSAPPVRGGHSGIRHPDAVLRRIDSCC